MVAKVVSLSAVILGVVAATPAVAELDIRAHERAAICESGSGQIEVTVDGVAAGGILAVELYRPSERDFLKKASRIHRIRVPARDAPQTVCFEAQPAGRYAVAAYHDVNGNRDLDQKWNRMPKEPFGLSTNPKLKLQVPDFEDAAFDVPENGRSITIALVK
ncbi:MAG: DUF2141 domain-containing protein [Pseudomonadota bacterium]